MDQNSSGQELILIESDPMVVRMRMAILQVLVWFFIYIDVFMLFTFFSKLAFRCNARYILFAHTLLMDTLLLLLADLVVLFGYFYVLLPVSHCIVLCMLMKIVSKNTPFTIAAMCLERYVAICMPLRHTSISTTSRTIAAIVGIWAFTSLNVIKDLIIVIVTAPPGYFAKPTPCYYQIMLVTEWHNLMNAIFNQLDCCIILLIILFCYTKIMLVAQAASGENKQSASKGRQTLLLHGAQLILSMTDLWGAYILAAVRNQSPQTQKAVRFFIFIAFTVVSRALSPLIYGLRDKTFHLALTHYMNCKVCLLSGKS